MTKDKKDIKFVLEVRIEAETILDMKKCIDELKTGIMTGKESFYSDRLRYFIHHTYEGPCEETGLEELEWRYEIIDGKTYIVMPSKMNKL